jgi:hypothetical protein
MRLIFKAGVLVLTLIAAAVSAQAGKLKNAPAGATLESDEVGGSSVVGVGERSFQPGEVLVSLPSNLSLEAIDALAQRHRLTRMESQSSGLLGRTVHRWRIADGRSIPAVILALKLDGGIAAQPNNIFTLQ